MPSANSRAFDDAQLALSNAQLVLAQARLALFTAEKSDATAHSLETQGAQIVVELLPNGQARVRTYWRGRFDSIVVARSDADVIGKDIPLAFAELRVLLNGQRPVDVSTQSDRTE